MPISSATRTRRRPSQPSYQGLPDPAPLMPATGRRASQAGKSQAQWHLAARAILSIVEQDYPLVRDVFPDLIAELATLLAEEGETGLAVSVREVRLIGECDCGDAFCQSIRTAEHPQGQPFGVGHRCVPLLPSEGILALDVVDDRIMYIEIVDRPRMYRRAAQP